MFDVMTEQPIGLEEVAAVLPGCQGQRVAVNTVRRWARDGLRGIRLETVMVGGRRCTSRKSVQRFIEATTEARERPPEQPRRRRARTDRHQQSVTRLREVYGLT